MPERFAIRGQIMTVAAFDVIRAQYDHELTGTGSKSHASLIARDLWQLL
jgi:hypothetical protein